jgi:myo-inositol-1(or 4)-monophosphatase
MTDYRKFAESIAREAGALLKDRFREKHTIDYKGEIDIVTEADKMSEEIIVSKIRQRFPDHGIMAEESAETKKDSGYRWIIDPLDGTTNYAHGFPVFCVSVALEKEGETILGVVYNPMLNELFTAQKNMGAFLNDEKISVSCTEDLLKSLLATGFPYDISRDPNNNINYFNGIIMEAQAIRRAGSAALDLAYVAVGRFDGFWELKLHPWDTAAGCLLVKEAGGITTTLSGGDFCLDSKNLLASNGKIHNKMIDTFKKIDPSDKRL